MENEKLIAFQTVDAEGDVWCNTALIFKDEDSVNRFFTNPKLVIETLKYELEDFENIDECIHIKKFPSGSICSVLISLEYCGECNIVRMLGGYFIE